MTTKNKLGFGDNKTEAPKDVSDLINLLSRVMSASLNNEVDLESAKVALNAATRIIEVIQADTRMKALAIATNRVLTSAPSGGYALIQAEKELPR